VSCPRFRTQGLLDSSVAVLAGDRIVAPVPGVRTGVDLLFCLSSWGVGCTPLPLGACCRDLPFARSSVYVLEGEVGRFSGARPPPIYQW